MNARVYFVEAQVDGLQGSRLLRLWLRRPARITRIAWQALGVAVIARLGRSSLTHVAIAVGDRVFVPTLSGGAVWPRDTFEVCYPFVAGFVDVSVNPIFRLDDDQRPYRLPCFLLAWLSRGRFDAHTCVGDVKAVLSAGGFATPRGVVTPEQLRRFLIGRGCRYVPLRPDRPQDGDRPS